MANSSLSWAILNKVWVSKPVQSRMFLSQEHFRRPTPLSSTTGAVSTLDPYRHVPASFIKLCPKSSPDIKQCLIDSLEHLRPFLAKGIPEFGLPSCEPLIIPEVFIDQGNGPVSVKSSYKDIEVFGASNFTIKNIKVDLDKDRVKIKLLIPALKVNSNYTMDGQILLMPISGSGPCFGNYTNIEAVVTMKGQKIEKEGEFYYNVQDCYIDFNIGHATLKFINLFNGNEELGDAMNLFLNDNWKTVVMELKPVLEDKLGEIFKKFANKIFHKYPISILFAA